MAKAVQVHKDSECAVWSIWLPAGKTWSGQDEQIFECPVQKIVLLKESEVWFPDE